MKISIGQWLLVGVLACSCQSGKKKTYCQKEPAALEAFEEGVPNQKIAEEQRNENVEVSPSEPVAVSDEAPTHCLFCSVKIFSNIILSSIIGYLNISVSIPNF